MLTPIFQIFQTDKHIIFKLRLPYVKVSSAETFIEGKLFKFHLHPYFLSLVLENEMLDNGIESAVYNHNDYCLTIKVLKKTEGEHFTNLEMISALLQPSKTSKSQKKLKPSIQVLDEQPNYQIDGNEEMAELRQGMDNLELGKYSYGFLRNFDTVFQAYQVN